VAELFEARKPKEFAIISEIDGIVSFGKDTKGKRKVVVTPEVGESKDYLIPKGKHISVHSGDWVQAGEPLMEGSTNPHDLLGIKGEKDLAKYLVDEVQEVHSVHGTIDILVKIVLKRDFLASDAEIIAEFVDQRIRKIHGINRKVKIFLFT